MQHLYPHLFTPHLGISQETLGYGTTQTSTCNPCPGRSPAYLTASISPERKGVTRTPASSCHPAPHPYKLSAFFTTPRGPAGSVRTTVGGEGVLGLPCVSHHLPHPVSLATGHPHPLRAPQGSKGLGQQVAGRRCGCQWIHSHGHVHTHTQSAPCSSSLNEATHTQGRRLR